MGALRYSINVTIDGCCDHRAIPADERMHRHHAANLERYVVSSTLPVTGRRVRAIVGVA